MEKSEAKALIQKQEDMLRFDHFTNEDVWELGCLFKKEIEEKGIDFVICISRPNGQILFQYASKNAQLSHQHWATCKFKVAAITGGSSMAMAIVGDPVKFNFDPIEYAFSGGAFPVKTKDGELKAIVYGSGMPHIKDHAFVVETIAKYLGVEDIPVFEGL